MKYDYIPSFSQIRVSLKRRSKEFFLENNICGVRYYSDPTRSKLERIIWFILTMLALVASIVLMVMLWGKLEISPTITGLDVDIYSIKIQFPSIFMCFDWPQLNHSILHETEKDLYKELYTWEWGKDITLQPNNNQKRLNLYHTFMNMMPNCGNIFNNCTFRNKHISCEKNLTKIITPSGVCCSFTTFRLLKIRDTSFDFTFVPKLYPFRLYMMSRHDAGPRRNLRPLEVIDVPFNLSFSAFITYASPSLKSLSIRRRECHFGTKDLSYNDCRIDCLSKVILENCGCLPWFLYYGRGKECLLSEYSCIRNFDISKNCECTFTCNHTSYVCEKISRAAYTDDVENVTCKIGLYSWPKIFYLKELRFGYLDLVTAFGGIAGLFLGYSLLNIIEFFYYITIRAYCGAVIDVSRKKHNIVKVHVIESKNSPTVLLNSEINSTYYEYIE